LSAARAVLRELELLHIPVIGLAKKEEEIYLPEQKNPLALPKSSRALKVLMRLRDEAHRFAVSYHRKIRSKRMTLSDLDQVAGLGPEKRKAILRVFGSVDALLQVSEQELAKVEGVGPELAERIQQTLKKAK
jgi:excinuclease ABC subunit C